MRMTTENRFEVKEKNGEHTIEKDDSALRLYMSVSVPVNHPDAPPRDGMVRAQYESIEIIREVPFSRLPAQSTTSLLQPPTPEHEKSRGRDRGNTIGFAESRGTSAKGERIDRGSGEKSETNAVEWIMISRSDPGGGIPRFMVERGTPSSIAADAVKFLDWATGRDEFETDDDDDEAAVKKDYPLEEVETDRVPLHRKLSNVPDDGSTYEPSKADDTGIISSLTAVFKEGVDRYAPEFVQDSFPALTTHPRGVGQDDDDDDGDSTDTSSMASFASAEQFTSAPDSVPGSQDALHLTVPKVNPPGADSSSELLPPSSFKSSDMSLSSQASDANAKGNDKHDKALAKLDAKRAELDAQFDADSKKEQDKAEGKSARDSKEADKARARIEREQRKREEKHAKELRRLERKKEAEVKKAEDRRRKADEADAVTRLTRERDQAKRMAEVLRLESEIWRERVGELQRENTLLVARLGKTEGGRDALKMVRDDVANRLDRTNSFASGHSSSASKASQASKGSKKEASPAASIAEGKSKET
jgi:hypothetical protein